MLDRTRLPFAVSDQRVVLNRRLSWCFPASLETYQREHSELALLRSVGLTARPGRPRVEEILLVHRHVLRSDVARIHHLKSPLSAVHRHEVGHQLSRHRQRRAIGIAFLLLLVVEHSQRRAVSGCHLRCLGKFILATQDSGDYSSFIWTGIIAGQSMALKSYPELHQGLAGYGRYYWRAFVDQGSGSFFTEAIVPALTHEDPRYYTLGHGGFFRRTGYALSRVVLTKTDSGGTSFNYSEIVGNGME